MRILLLRLRPHRQTIGLQSVMICEPLELMTLKPVLEKNGHHVSLVDGIVDRRPISAILREGRPDLVGLTGYISHVGIMRACAREIKAFSQSILVAVGGVHAEVCPEDFEDDPNIDFIAGSAAALYAYTGCADPSPELPDRALPRHYRRCYYYMFHRNCALMKTSFGCPYHCNFCFCKEISPYRARDLDEVMTELAAIEQQEIYLVDDDFLFDRVRLLDFADRVERSGLRKRFLVYGRADFIAKNPDIIARLAQVGLRAVIVGLEAASQEQLDAYQKHTTLGDNEQAVRILRQHGVECYATVILGIDWTREQFQTLYRFLRRLELVFVNLQPFTPMPHTPYFEQYGEQLIIPYTEHHRWDMAHLVVSPTRLSVRRFYWETIKLYYKLMVNPRQGWYMARRYGLWDTLKLSLGAGRISLQYLYKVIRG